jgi:hypothetical protein
VHTLAEKPNNDHEQQQTAEWVDGQSSPRGECLTEPERSLLRSEENRHPPALRVA